MLERLADYTEERQASNATVKKALIYPSVLVIASILIVSFLLAYVVPQVVQVFEGMNQELPALTRAMLASSAFVREWGLLIAGVVTVFIIVFKRAMKGEGFKTRVHSLLLKLPLFRRLIQWIQYCSVRPDTEHTVRQRSACAASIGYCCSGCYQQADAQGSRYRFGPGA